ncbi:CHAT domain-containing protein [Ilyonectria sp. MPI-CAGE-AT-0026]|nr:CHAT domain-containing protein [Ilyonectria sp. MPI-CAGE-AT-0026]
MDDANDAENKPKEDIITYRPVTLLTPDDTHSQAMKISNKDDQWIDENIEARKGALTSMPLHLRERRFFCELTELTLDRYRRTGGAEYLDDSIRLEREALEYISTGFQRARCLLSLGRLLHSRFQLKKTVQQMAQAVRAGQQNVYPPSVKVYSVTEHNASLHSNKSPGQAAMESALVDMDEAIAASWTGLELLPGDYPQRGKWLGDLASMYSARYSVSSVIEDLDQAIQISRNSLEKVSQEGNSVHFGILIEALLLRCSVKIQEFDALEAMQRCKEVLDTPLRDRETMLQCLQWLAEALLHLHHSTGRFEALDESLDVSKKAIDMSKAYQSLDVRCRRFRGGALFEQYQKTGNLATLDESIIMAGSVAKILFTPTPQSKSSLFTILLRGWGDETGTFPDSGQLSEALDWPACVPLFGTTRMDSLHELCGRHYERYERSWLPGDLDNVVRILRQMVEMIPSPKLRSHLAHRLLDLYSEHGVLTELLYATKVCRQLVEESTEGPEQNEFSLSLALSLCFHHERKGIVVELDEAIEIGTRIFETTTDGDELYPPLLSNLGEILYQKCRVDMTLPNIERTINILERALDPNTGLSPVQALSKTAQCLLWKYRITGEIAHLDTAVRLAKQAAASLPSKYPRQHSIILHRLALSLHERYLINQTRSDLDEAIELERQNLSVLSSTCYLSHVNLASLLSELHIVTGSTADLEESMELAASQLVRGHYSPCARGGCGQIPNILSIAQTKEVADRLGTALETMQDCHPQKARYLSSLALMHTMRVEKAAAIQYAREAIDLVSDNHPDFPWHLCCLVLCLDASFTETGNASVLEEMITLAEQARDLSAQDHAGKPFYSTVLSITLYRRFGSTTRSSDLNQAIEYAIEAFNMAHGDTLPDRHNRYLASYHLSLCLQDKYLREGHLSDLEQAKQLHRESQICIRALDQGGAFFSWLRDSHNGPYSVHLGTNTKGSFELRNKGHVHAILPDKLNCHGRLFALANEYFQYYEDGIEDYLSSALQLCDSSLESICEAHIAHSARLHLRGRCYEEFYNRSLSDGSGDDDRRNRIDDLTMAISTFRELIDRLPFDDPLRSDVLFRLGRLYSDKLYYNCAIEDVKLALEVHQECLDLTPEGHSDRGVWLRHLGCTKNTAYHLFGDKANLDEALSLLEQAKELNTGDIVHRQALVPSLATTYRRKFDTTRDLKDIDSAIKVYHDAESLYSNPVGRNLILTWLGGAYLHRYGLTKAPADVNEAVSNLEQALDTIPKSSENSERLNILISLARCYLRKHGHAGAMADLDAATKYAQDAANVTSPDDSQYLSVLEVLGSCYHQRFQVTKQDDDIRLAIETDEEALWQSLSNVNISDVLEVAQRLLKAYILVKNWHKGFQFAEYALELIPLYTPRYLQISEAQALLSKVNGLASLAAAFSLELGNDDQDTLATLERGRGVVADYVYDLRVDFDSRKFSGMDPEMRRTLVSNLSQLEGPSRDLDDSPGLPADQARSSLGRLTRKIAASKSLDALVGEFNKRIHGYRVGPRNANFSVFTKKGPIVIINVSYRCDAFLIKNMIEVLHLPKLSREEIDRRLQEENMGSTKVLEWLWDTITGPVLDKLGYTQSPADGEWPQVCWIATGALSRFPLHAAGYHTDLSGKTVLDRVMSSYSSSFTAIKEGAWKDQGPSSTKAVMVAMQNTPGSKSLPSATKELSIVRGLCESMSLESIEPARFTKHVLSELKDCHIFHFAGHGVTDQTNPLKSHLRLEDWKTQPLTVANLLNMNLRDNPPFLAYLSACGTSRIKDKRLLDESLHLISACQLAGFRHVIGTLWEVDDEACVDVAKITYSEMRDAGMEDDSVCRGLHKAVRAMRDTWLAESSKTTAQRARSSLENSSSKEKARIVSDGGFPPSELRSARDAVIEEEDEELGPAPWVAYVHYRGRV